MASRDQTVGLILFDHPDRIGSFEERGGGPYRLQKGMTPLQKLMHLMGDNLGIGLGMEFITLFEQPTP